MSGGVDCRLQGWISVIGDLGLDVLPQQCWRSGALGDGQRRWMPQLGLSSHSAVRTGIHGGTSTLTLMSAAIPPAFDAKTSLEVNRVSTNVEDMISDHESHTDPDAPTEEVAAKAVSELFHRGLNHYD
jgi:hypothetical protein